MSTAKSPPGPSGASRATTACPTTGFLNDATWPALIDAYMRQDRFDVPDEKFLRNANPDAGCDGGILKWLGSGEDDPVLNTENAWRPNRRTELLLVRVERLPCDAPRPATFDLPEPGAVAPTWCLGPDEGDRSCFLRRAGGAHQEPERILVQPAHQPAASVLLTLKFEDGSPAVDVPYVLIAPDGEFMDGEIGPPGNPRRGEPVPGQVGAAGSRAYAKPSGGVGVWTLEVQASVVARLRRGAGRERQGTGGMQAPGRERRDGRRPQCPAPVVRVRGRRQRRADPEPGRLRAAVPPARGHPGRDA